MKNKKILESFHHGAIRRILNIRWDQVKNERIRNKQVRFRFCNIQKIESYINKRTATYVGKIARASDDELPKKLLGAWMHQPRKAGGQQLSCNNNFTRAVCAIIPNIQAEHQGLLFRDWFPLALSRRKRVVKLGVGVKCHQRLFWLLHPDALGRESSYDLISPLCVSYLVQWTVPYSVQLRMMYGVFPEYG